MTYPHVYSEEETLACAIAGASIARYGDGEIRLALGGQSASQRADGNLALELRQLLAKKREVLVCIPNAMAEGPHKENWAKYATSKTTDLYRDPPYGSTWITRPDSAPWINNAAYWDRVRRLWGGKDVTLVTGDEKSLTADFMSEARSVRTIMGTRQHSYSIIDKLEAEVGDNPNGPVLLCLGAAATVLAARLARKGHHALDLGHIGMFMRRFERNLYADDVASPEYRAVLQQRYEQPGWGGSGKHWADTVITFAKEIGAASVLDYGCGRGTMKEHIIKFQAQRKEKRPLKVHEYDPGIIKKAQMPGPADLVVATDVLEHIERDRVKNVVTHIRDLARKGVFLTIGQGPAREILPDGRNAHLIQEAPAYWIALLKEHGLGNIVKQHLQKSLQLWIKI